MEWTTFLSHLSQGNSVSSWFFKSVQTEDELGLILVSMANTKGGHVFVGMDLKNYHLVGCDDDPQFISYMVKRFCFPDFPLHISTLDRNGKTILVIHVPESTVKPCFFKKRCFVMSLTAPFGPIEQTHLQPPAAFTLIENPVVAVEPPVTPSSSPTQEKHEESHVAHSQPTQPSHTTQPDSVSVAVAVVSQTMNDRQKKTIDYLQSHFSISNKTYRTLFQVSHKTAHIELVALVESGFLQTQGSGRSTCYIKK